MAKCIRCDREMDTADGCSIETAMIDGKIFDRIRVGDPGDASEGGGTANRCRDCNALHGHHHHWICDSERCPACGHLLTSCRCGEVRAMPETSSCEPHAAVKALCYSRAAGTDPCALDWQNRANIKYAREQGFNVVARIEESGSGRSMRRPGIQQMMMHVERHDFDVLILDNLSRLGRGPSLVLPLLRRLRENGIRVMSPRMGSLDDQIRRIDLINAGIREAEGGASNEVF